MESKNLVKHDYDEIRKMVGHYRPDVTLDSY